MLCFFQREQQTAEIMMIQKMMNEDLKETLEEEKRTVKRNPGKICLIFVIVVSFKVFHIRIKSGFISLVNEYI